MGMRWKGLGLQMWDAEVVPEMEIGSGGFGCLRVPCGIMYLQFFLHSNSKRDEFSPSLDLLLYIPTCTDVDFEQG